MGRQRATFDALSFGRHHDHHRRARVRSSSAVGRSTARSVRGNLTGMRLTIETEREDDGRWIAEVPQLPGALSYGATVEDAVRAVRALALEILAGRLRAGESIDSIQFVAA